MSATIRGYWDVLNGLCRIFKLDAETDVRSITFKSEAGCFPVVTIKLLPTDEQSRQMLELIQKNKDEMLVKMETE